MPGSGSNIKVVVRCRPMNARELARGDQPIISISGKTTTIEPPPETAGSSSRATERKPMSFSFDHSYASYGSKSDADYASQDTLYQDLGLGLLEHAFAGFNTSLYCYGQTGSGKSYSMLGYGADKGLMPLICAELFRRAEAQRVAREGLYSYTVETSYIEIYNEKVKDLLNPKNQSNLKVREHPSLGPYVEDLSKLVVGSFDDIERLMDDGNKARTIAATQMNETSSRSHAIFTLIFTQKTHDNLTGLDAEKVSRISLVDLAGSERANSTGATGARLKEGANINKSLTTLGKVIAALAAASAADPRKKKKEDHVPYRDSVLTWLLRDCLGGNSQTTMIAAIAPSSASYEETLSTLRYADKTKQIKTRPVVNEDPTAKMIRELKEELQMLRTRATSGGGTGAEAVFDPSIPPEQQMVSFLSEEGEVRTISKAVLQEQMQTSEKLLKSVNESWEEKIQKTEEARKEREQALEELGITVEKGGVGVHTPKRMPHLVNLNEDPLMSECLVYQLKPGITTVGNADRPGSAATIKLSGTRILAEHCRFANEGGAVTIDAVADSMTIVNGKRVVPGQPHRLRSGHRVVLGDYYIFRFQDPEAARKQRDLVKTSMSQSVSASSLASTAGRPDSPSVVDEGLVDWSYARRELALARLNGQDPALDHLRDEDLDKLFDDVIPGRTQGHQQQDITDAFIARLLMQLQKVRTLRKRPESRLSLGDDIWSRHQSSDFTDDTSLEANASNPWGEAADDSPADDDPELDDLSARLAKYQANLPAVEAADSAIEKAQLEIAVVAMAQEVKRLQQERAQGAHATQQPVFVPEAFSARAIRLARMVIDRWRTKNTLALAEKILKTAVLVKEANVLSRRLHKDVAYNFVVTAGVATSALGDFIDGADAHAPAAGRPELHIKVVDAGRNTVVLWTFDQFKQRLGQMRNLLALADKPPAFAKHFSSIDAFSDGNASPFSHVGSAALRITPVFRHVSFAVTSPIFSIFTAEAIGSCRITVTMTSKPVPSRLIGSFPGSDAASLSLTTVGGRSPLDVVPVPGATMGFVLTVDEVKGLTLHDFAELHLQIRLSSLAGLSVNEEVFPSNVVKLEKQAASHLAFRRTFSFIATPEIISHLRTGYAQVELFAKCQPTYLEGLVRWDTLRELLNWPSGPTSTKRPDLMRRASSSFSQEEQHDIALRLQVLELDAAGKWTSVPVQSQGPLDPGSFFVQQGLQRRLRFSLLHGSGKALRWVNLSRATVGQIRFVGKGTAPVAEEAAELDLRILPASEVEPPVVVHPDGTSTLTAEALWDSSAHDSASLNRPSASGQRVLLRLTVLVQIDNAERPATFTHDVSLKILARGAGGPGSFLNSLWGQTRLVKQTTALFSLVLSPSPIRSAADLWRLDTSQTFVPGEKALPPDWHVRGVSAVKDYLKLQRIERLSADVRAVEALSAACHRSASSPQIGPENRDPVDLKRKIVELWSRPSGAAVESVLTRSTAPTSTLLAGLVDLSPKLVPSVTLSQRSAVVAKKKGWLHVLVDAPGNVWVKRFCVLRRPYLHLYLSSAEADEVTIINLTSDRSTGGVDLTVVSSPEVEHLLGRPHAFTCYSRRSSHVFAATSAKDELAWRQTFAPNTST